MDNLNARESKDSSYSKGVSRGYVSKKERLLAPDLGRGFMLLIIALAHAPLWLNAGETNLMGMPIGGNVIDEVINFFSILLVDNRGLPLFAILLGYGLTMMVDRQLSAGTTVAESKRLLRRRGLFLLLFGFVHAVIIGGIDILAFYGFATLIIGWLLFRRDYILNRAILSVAIVFLIPLPIIWVSMANMLDAAGGKWSFRALPHPYRI